MIRPQLAEPVGIDQREDIGQRAAEAVPGDDDVGDFGMVREIVMGRIDQRLEGLVVAPRGPAP